MHIELRKISSTGEEPATELVFSPRNSEEAVELEAWMKVVTADKSHETSFVWQQYASGDMVHHFYTGLPVED